MKLFSKPRALDAERWDGTNREAIDALCRNYGPSPRRSGARWPNLEIWSSFQWRQVPVGWWVVQLENGLVRMTPELVERYYSEGQPEHPAVQYYEAMSAARSRLSRVSVGVEQLALEIGTHRGDRALGLYIQDELRKLLCIHPLNSLREASEETWCDICLSRVEAADQEARAKELMAHIVVWCKCDTEACPVHTDANSELPAPTLMRKTP